MVLLIDRRFLVPAKLRVVLYFPGIIKEFTILFTENGCQGFIENINVTHRFSPNFIVSFIIVIILYLKNRKNK